MKAKKIITLLVALAMLATFMVVPVSAETAVTVEVKNATILLGGQGSVDIHVTGAATGSIGFYVTYNTEKLTYVSGEFFGTAAESANTSITCEEAGTVSVLRIDDLVGDYGKFVTLTFEATDTIEGISEDITVTPVFWAEQNLNAGYEVYTADDMTFTPGTVSIVDQHVAPTFDLAIEGDAKAGAELTAVITNFVDNWGVTAEEAAFSYSWMADGDEVGTDEAYTLTAAEIGKTISLEVVASVEGLIESEDALTSEPVEVEMESPVIADPEAFAYIEGEVTIDGTLKVGKTLTAKYEFVASVNGGEDASTFAWYTVDEEGTETLIEGATDAKYKLTNAEKDLYIKVVVTPKGENDVVSGTPGEFTTEATVAKKSNSPAGDIGVGTVLPGVNPEKPGTETPGTETPGTEEPGTDEPGTETPGTEEPGTEAPATSAESFKDFPKENYTWAYDAVDTLVKSGVIEGKNAESFDPEGTTTNAEFLAMVIRAMGIETEDAAEGEHWATNIVAKATELGLLEHVEALENDTAITREEMFTILYKALVAAEKTVEAGDASEFTDAASISDFAVEATGALVKAGIVNGMGDGTVAPKGTGTRAQVATVIFRAFFN